MPQHEASARPDVSVIIPVYDKLPLTRACVSSLRRTPGEASFEIVVVDNGSRDGTAAWLEGERAAGRLRVVSPGGNLGFAAGCNAGAAAARGRYLLFLNNDTEVTPGWLDPLVTTLDRDPAVHAVGSKLLYPDGTIQHGGVALLAVERGDATVLEGLHLAARKPADDPGANRPQRLQAVTAACLLVRTGIFDDLGGFDTCYWNGNEDVDLCLRIGEGGGLVVYRPESVVVHHESQSGPERWSRTGDNIALFNERWLGRAEPDFRRAADGTVAATDADLMRPYTPPALRLAEPAGSGTVSVVVLTWNALDYTRLCADSLLRHTDPRHELLFVDNGSRPDTLAYLGQLAAAHPQVTVVRNGANLGFAAGNNVGLARARSEHVCLLNSDTVVTDGWLERLLAPLERDPAVGLVGPVTNAISGAQRLPAVDYDDHNLTGLDAFASGRAAAHADVADPALLLVGFCLLIRRHVVAQIGGLDEGFGQGNYEDTDYCLRAFLAGWKSVVARDCFIHHFGSRSFVAGRVDYGRELRAKWEIFRRKWRQPAEGYVSGELELDDLLVEGFVPALHSEPLPAGGHVVRWPLAGWEVARGVALGEALFAAGRPADAERVFRGILRDHPGHDRAAGDLACVLWNADRDAGRDEAVTLLEGVLARNPDDEDARWNLDEILAAACENA